MCHGFQIYFPHGFMGLAGIGWLRGLDKIFGESGVGRILPNQNLSSRAQHCDGFFNRNAESRDLARRTLSLSL
jgi:hypothetical protein